jgi:hypothetical protein
VPTPDQCASREAGQSTFASQWMLWDRIRSRLEPHEIMFPGLERLPRMSMDQMRRVRADLAKAGYMSSSKQIDEATGMPKLNPVRALPSASRAGSFALPAGIALGLPLLEILREEEEAKRRQGA